MDDENNDHLILFDFERNPTCIEVRNEVTEAFVFAGVNEVEGESKWIHVLFSLR